LFVGRDDLEDFKNDPDSEKLKGMSKPTQKEAVQDMNLSMSPNPAKPEKSSATLPKAYPDTNPWSRCVPPTNAPMYPTQTALNHAALLAYVTQFNNLPQFNNIPYAPLNLLNHMNGSRHPTKTE